MINKILNKVFLPKYANEINTIVNNPGYTEPPIPE